MSTFVLVVPVINLMEVLRMVYIRSPNQSDPSQSTYYISTLLLST